MSADNFLVKDGKALEFEIITNQNKQREMTAVLIQRRLKEIGIKVSIRVIEWASFVNRFIKPGDFDVVVLGLELIFGSRSIQYLAFLTTRTWTIQFCWLR